MTTKIFRSRLLTILASHGVKYQLTPEGPKILDWDQVPLAVKTLLTTELLAANAITLEEGEEIAEVV